MKRQLEREIEQTRAEWEREKEEYRYAFAREQQQARDEFLDDTARANKELAERKAAAERELAERERAVKAREDELAALRKRVEGLPNETDAAVARAVKEALSRQQQEAASREELLKREFAGERNVLVTRISLLEQIAKEQAEQLTRLQDRADKAYGQVQDIAVRAIEGSGSAKQLTRLQQMLADRARKGGGER